MHSCFPANYTAEFVVDPPDLPSDYTFTTHESHPAKFRRIRVETNNGNSWTADVPVEDDIPRRALNQVISTPDPNVAVVVVGGMAYLVPVDDPSELDILELGEPIIGLLCAVDERLLVFASDWRITAISENGIQWQTDRLAIEGLHLEDAGEKRLWAIADPDTASRDVILDLSTGRVIDPTQAKFPPTSESELS